MTRFVRALFHELFCWNAMQRVPDLALFSSMGDYVFPVICTRCGSRAAMEGTQIRRAFGES